MKPFNFADAYNRPQEIIAPSQQAPHAVPPIQYTDYGYVPGVAQSIQNIPPTNFVQGRSFFNETQLAMANWFTTRVHLSPLGKG